MTYEYYGIFNAGAMEITQFQANSSICTASVHLLPWHHIDGLVQDCSNSSALAMELLQSCAKPSIYQTWCKSVVSPLLMHWRYYSFALSHRSDQQASLSQLGDVMALNKAIPSPTFDQSINQLIDWLTYFWGWLVDLFDYLCTKLQYLHR